MGSNMARNLIEKGRELVVYDVNEKATEQAVNSKKAIRVNSPKEVAEQCDGPVFTMLPNNQIVLDVYSDPQKGLIAGAKKGNYLVDCSTVSPETSKTLHERSTAAGVNFHDAPVAGAEPAAITGTLTFMVGGEKSSVKNIEPFLNDMGKKIFNTGAIGTGSVAKICNNMLLAICMLGTSEAILMGERLGVDPKMLTEIINVSSGRNWSSEIYNPVPGIVSTAPSARNYSGGFLVKYLTKDLGLAQGTAHAGQTSTPLGSTAHQLYQIMNRSGYSDKDFSIIYKFIKGEKP
ncbi:hypothetical protein RND71_043900 [Anisodus tanguticus]|uniref:3-hydroxyisobutyrate dehydrogenase n=1 Tax=Anisodus tanguticus TaxID=243964 RepID=A0AAE1QN63_9SOLA|nr:hypothetical protein RND71_043900 [Anisodus tanguticus]